MMGDGWCLMEAALRRERTEGGLRVLRVGEIGDGRRIVDRVQVRL
jgi:hypothetical protein